MKKLTGKKILMVIAKSKYRDEEYLEPRKVLEDAGAVITVASSSFEPVRRHAGAHGEARCADRECEEEDFDGIVFVGGGGASEYFDSPVAHRLARGFFEQGKLTSAICIAPATLANAGVLKGKKATAFPSSEAALRTHEAIFMKQDVVSDGTIVTAVGPQAAKRFGEKLVEVLA